MGHTISSCKEGKMCCKCKKTLIKWDDARDIKMEATEVHDGVSIVKKVFKGDRQIGWYWYWDPSKGRTTGYLYDFFCMDCWDPKWVE